MAAVPVKRSIFLFIFFSRGHILKMIFKGCLHHSNGDSLVEIMLPFFSSAFLLEITDKI